MKFNDFAEQAADLFGFNRDEATELLSELADDGFDLRSDSLEDWGDEVVDYAMELIGSDLEEPWWDYELDDRFLDDEWIYPGEEWELTADYTET